MCHESIPFKVTHPTHVLNPTRASPVYIGRVSVSTYAKASLRNGGLKKCVEIKCQLDATEVYISDLIVCSTCFGHHYANHQELKSIIQWLLPVVFRAVVFQVAGLVWS